MLAVTAATSSGSSLATSTTFPPSSPASVAGAADDRHVLEQPARGRRLRPDEPERRVVDEVHHVHPARAQDPLDLVEEFGRREMPRHGEAAERIADDEVDAVVRHGLDRPPRIADDDPDRVAWGEAELLASDLEHARIELEHGLARTRPRRLEVAREREPAATDMEDVGRAIEPVQIRSDRVGEPPLVSELEVGRIGQVDIRMRQPVEDEDPAVRVVGSTSTAMQ